MAALALDLLCLAVGVLLANGSQPLAGFFLFGGATGLVVAPLVGWRYGRAAADGQPVARWAPNALGLTLLVGLGLWFAYVVVGITLWGVPGGQANFGPFIVLAVFETTVFGLVVTLIVTLPLGALWLGLMWLIGRRLSQPGVDR